MTRCRHPVSLPLQVAQAYDAVPEASVKKTPGLCFNIGNIALGEAALDDVSNAFLVEVRRHCSPGCTAAACARCQYRC